MSKNYTKKDVLKAWNEGAGKEDQFDLVEITAADGTEQTQIFDKPSGSLCVAVNGHGQAALNKLGENPNVTFIDGGLAPKESADRVKNEKKYTSDGVLRTPTQPDVLEDVQNEPVEIDNKKQRGESAPQTAERTVTRARRRAAKRS